MGAVELSVLCWDHPRCTRPVRAAAAEWSRRHPDVRLTIAARPLSAFNDQPIEEVAGRYDLLFVDHPMVGRVAAGGALARLDELLPGEVLSRLSADAIAGSQDAYRWDGHAWATAVDAACQVAVCDDEGLRLLGARAPRRWAEVLRLARDCPGSVALPLYPSDAILSLLSIQANLRAHHLAPDGLLSREAAELFVALVDAADPRSFDLNPPRMLDLVASAAPGTAPAYVPLVFGYTDYARPGNAGRRLRFLDVPSADGEPLGAVLGGAGLGVSASATHRAEAAAFAAWLAGAEAQREIVLPCGGQPASRATWDDPAADAVVGGFFSGTRATIENSFVRPRERWWPAFQEAAGLRLVHLLRRRTAAAEVHRDLSHLLDSHRTEEPVR